MWDRANHLEQRNHSANTTATTSQLAHISWHPPYQILCSLNWYFRPKKLMTALENQFLKWFYQLGDVYLPSFPRWMALTSTGCTGNGTRADVWRHSRTSWPGKSLSLPHQTCAWLTRAGGGGHDCPQNPGSERPYPASTEWDIGTNKYMYTHYPQYWKTQGSRPAFSLSIFQYL